jgi:hypothetical protein
MSILPPETTETINRLKQQALRIVHEATAAELLMFERFGETEVTITFLEDLKTVAEDATSSFSQLSTLELNIARSQPTAPPAMLDLLGKAIERTQARIPPWERSIQEVKLEWNLP